MVHTLNNSIIYVAEKFQFSSSQDFVSFIKYIVRPFDLSLSKQMFEEEEKKGFERAIIVVDEYLINTTPAIE